MRLANIGAALPHGLEFIQTMRLTHIGTATLLIEVGGLRILTDPALDHAGQKYGFGPGASSVKTAEPVLPKDGLGKIDAVFISHDQHADNLDDAGRAAIANVPLVLTTKAASKRLGREAIGLAPWESHQLSNGIEVIATPARHGPPLSLPVVGPVVGFILRWPEQKHGVVYISGDTVWFSGLAEVAKRFKVGTAILHLGGVQLAPSGPVRYTLDAKGAVKLVDALNPRTVIPIHYDGWTHFKEPLSTIEAALAKSGHGEKLRRLPLGEGVELEP